MNRIGLTSIKKCDLRRICSNPQQPSSSYIRVLFTFTLEMEGYSMHKSLPSILGLISMVLVDHSNVQE